jgi:hypothetical protein
VTGLVTDATPSLAKGSHAVGIAAQVIGLLVFVGGITMVVFVFAWTYRVFTGVDEQIAQVKPAPATGTTSPPALTGQDAGKSPKVVIAAPRVGPSLGQVAATLAVKFLALAVLAWMASLVAARGAALAMGRRST